MSEFSLTSPYFEDGEKMPKKFGYKHGNEEPEKIYENVPNDAICFNSGILLHSPEPILYALTPIFSNLLAAALENGVLR